MTYSFKNSVHALLLLALGACARGEVATSDVVRADSAGVRIVTSTASDRELAWRLEEIDVFRDTLGEPWIFESLTPQRAVTDRAGRTYVLTREPSIARFGRDGRYERSFGRKGGAPGEMQFAVALLVQGDSLAVLDPVRGALVRFDPELQPIADIPLRDRLADVSAIAFRQGGLWVQRSTFAGGRTALALFSDTLATVPMLSVLQPPTAGVAGCGGRLRISLPPLFAPEIIWVAERGRLLANVGPRYELLLYEGPRLLASVRRDLPMRAPTEDDVRRLYPEGLRVATASIGNCVFETAALIKAPGLAAEFPHVHGLAFLSDGTIWVQRTLRDETPSVLDVFGSDGAYVGTVRGLRLPLALLPNGELLVPREDEDSGGQLLVRMRVVR